MISASGAKSECIFSARQAFFPLRDLSVVNTLDLEKCSSQCVLALHFTFPRLDAFLVVATKIKKCPYLEYQNTRKKMLFKKATAEKEMGVLYL
jgi:hypothetical protein